MENDETKIVPITMLCSPDEAGELLNMLVRSGKALTALFDFCEWVAEVSRADQGPQDAKVALSAMVDKLADIYAEGPDLMLQDIHHLTNATMIAEKENGTGSGTRARTSEDRTTVVGNA